jgi:3,4-dihydroxy 2-butanone 4-phosphate synthase/GTP cyclohydrolase II
MLPLKKFAGAKTKLPTWALGELDIESQFFSAASDGDLVASFGAPFESQKPLVRIHSECVFAEVFDSRLCDCADQLRMALDLLHRSKRGLLFYLRIDGRGAGLSAKVAATSLEVSGHDTYDSRVAIGVAPEGRAFEEIGTFLKARGVKSIELLSNNPSKREDLVRVGLAVELVPLKVQPRTPEVERLLETKKKRFGHIL